MILGRCFRDIKKSFKNWSNDIISQQCYVMPVKNRLNDSVGACAYFTVPFGSGKFFKMFSESLGPKFPFSPFVFRFIVIVFIASVSEKLRSG